MSGMGVGVASATDAGALALVPHDPASGGSIAEGARGRGRADTLLERGSNTLEAVCRLFSDQRWHGSFSHAG